MSFTGSSASAAVAEASAASAADGAAVVLAAAAVAGVALKLGKEVVSSYADYEQLVGDLNLVKLHEIFQIMLKRNEDKIDPIRSNFGNVEKEEIDMEEKASYIEDFIMKHKKFSFRELLERQHSKEEIIVSFLVILELIKVGRIKVKQDKINDDITITTVAKAG